MELKNLKPRKRAIAISLAMAALSGQALAAAPANPLTSSAQIDVYLSGAVSTVILGELAAALFGANNVSEGCAATDNMATTNINERFCNFHTIYNSGVNIGVDYRAYYGALRAAFSINGRTLSAGTTVLLTNRSKGGTFFGINPIARSFPIATMPVNSGCTFVSGNTAQYNYTCPASGIDGSSGRRPDFGGSEAPPALFKAPHSVLGTGPIFGPLSVAEVGNLKTTAVYAMQLGVPATNAVPPTFSTANGASVTGFNKAIYSALLSGRIADWSQIDSNIITGNTGVVICRRTLGSGIQATYNAYFHHFPCTVNSVVSGSNTAPVRMESSSGITPFTLGGTDPITIDPTAGFTVVENPSSANVRDCLWRAQTNQNHTFNWTDDLGGIHPVTVRFANTPGTPYRAIGLLANDSDEGTNGAGTQTNSWTFHNFNRVPGMIRTVFPNLPNKPDVRIGDWDLTADATMQYRIDGYINAAGNFVSGPVPAGVERQRRDFIDLFIQRVGDPAMVSFLGAAVAIPNAVNNPSVNNNVAFVSRDGNTCAPNEWVGF